MSGPTVTLIIFAVVTCNGLVGGSACGRVTRCAVSNCFNTDKVQNAIYNSTRDEMFNTILNKFSFVCIASKCRADCRNCDHCRYALTQIKSLVSGKNTDMQCPKMEQCSIDCMKNDLNEAIPCVRKNCNVHCFDGDCSPCAGMAKRIFLTMCREHNVTSLPLVHYDGSCLELFNQVVSNFINKQT